MKEIIKKIALKIIDFIKKNWKFITVVVAILLVFSKILAGKSSQQIKKEIKEIKKENKDVIKETNDVQDDVKNHTDEVKSNTEKIKNNKEERDKKANDIFNVGD